MGCITANRPKKSPNKINFYKLITEIPIAYIDIKKKKLNNITTFPRISGDASIEKAIKAFNEKRHLKPLIEFSPRKRGCLFKRALSQESYQTSSYIQKQAKPAYPC